MSRVGSPSAAEQLCVLFEGGPAAGLSDRELIERFIARRDATGEAAFAALVARHGPMVMRICRHVPEVFMPRPAHLVVSEAVAGRLAHLPNLARQPVAFTKLFDFPYQARDFSYVEDLRRLGGRFVDMPDFDTSESEEHFYDVVRDVIEYHFTIGTYYQLVMARLRDIIEKYQNLRPITITPQSITGELTLDISRELLRDYQVFWNKAYFCTEEAFAAFDPALDRDYYYVKCVDVDL